MSFKSTGLFPSNPVTERGTSTKISASANGKQIVYTNGRNVIIRDLDNPLLSSAYSGHVQNATVARISPSGYYCASSDASGTVRVWDLVGEDRTLKGEYKVISGRINDLAWDGESKRIIAVGDGRDKFGHAFMFDTGSSTGEITGNSKAINAVAIRHQRPFRAATAGDDGLIVFHQGVPFKYDKAIKTHTKFVQDVRYAPSGAHFASVGSDFKIFIYDGQTGETIGEFTDSPHKGSIMAGTWSPDSTSLATSSADNTVKLWDVATKKAVTTWTVGAGVQNQQVGGVWSSENAIVSLSMSGTLNVFDPRVGDKPSQILTAPQRPVTAAVPTSSETFIAGTADGRTYAYSLSSKETSVLGGEAHTNYLSGLSVPASDGKVYSVGYDDRVREIDVDGSSFWPASAATSTQPKSIAVSEDAAVFVAEISSVEVFKSNQRVFEQALSFTPGAVAANGRLVAVGGEDQKIRLNEWDGKTLKEIALFQENRGAISALAFSPDGKLLAAGDSSGRIALYDVQEKKLVTGRWTFHTARINSLAWTPDSLFCASGSLDTLAYVWSVAKPMKNIAIKNAGPGGVNAVLWLEATNGGKSRQLVSAGADGCSRLWEVSFHA